MTAMAHSHDNDGGIELTPLSATEWRVTNRRVSPDDARSLVAFVEKIGAGYELMRFADPIEFGSFRSMDDVVAHLSHLFTGQASAGARITDLATVRDSHRARDSHLAEQK